MKSRKEVVVMKSSKFPNETVSNTSQMTFSNETGWGVDDILMKSTNIG